MVALAYKQTEIVNVLLIYGAGIHPEFAKDISSLDKTQSLFKGDQANQIEFIGDQLKDHIDMIAASTEYENNALSIHEKNTALSHLSKVGVMMD